MSKIILLVDDDVDVVESNKDLLEAQGYAVIAAHDGESGLPVDKILEIPVPPEKLLEEVKRELNA